MLAHYQIRTIMKIIGLLLLAAVGLWVYFKAPFVHTDNAKILTEASAPYIDVYGRKDCDHTNTVRRQLEAQNVHYRYFDLEQKTSADQLHPYMHRSGMATDKYLLPVVDVNGKLQQRPNLDKVMEIYQGEKQIF